MTKKSNPSSEMTVAAEELKMDEMEKGGGADGGADEKAPLTEEEDELTPFFPVAKPGETMSFLRTLYILFEDPNACTMSKALSVFIFSLILISSVSTWIESTPKYRYPEEPTLTHYSCPSDAGPSCKDGLPVFKDVNFFCMLMFLAEYCIRAIAVFGSDVDPWLDIELTWPLEAKKNKRGRMIYSVNDKGEQYQLLPGESFDGAQVMVTSDDNQYAGLYHKDFAPDGEKMGGGRKFSEWFWKALTLIDLIAICPFILDLTGVSKHLDGLVSLRYFRLMRVFRVLKLQKQTIAVALFVNTIKLSAGPLMVLMFFVMMCIAVFGAVIYTVEGGDYCPASKSGNGAYYHTGTTVFATSGDTMTLTSTEDEYTQTQCTIWGKTMDSCCGTDAGCRCRLDLSGDSAEESIFFSTFMSMWWVLTTITTVGYGDTYPTSTTGRLIGAMVMVMGVVGFSMPIGIIGMAFEEEYHRLSANPKLIDEAVGVESRNVYEGQEVFDALISIANKKGFTAKQLSTFIKSNEN